MPSSLPRKSGGRGLYLIASALAGAALALGLWDVLVERDGGGWFWPIAFPAALLLMMLVLLFRTPRRARGAPPPRAAGDPNPDEEAPRG